LFAHDREHTPDLDLVCIRARCCSPNSVAVQTRLLLDEHLGAKGRWSGNARKPRISASRF